MRDYPLGLHIETTGRCNSNCKFCPHSRSPRKDSMMAPELFTKILTEAREIPHPFTISPFKLGEPMLDPLFAVRLLRIDDLLPQATIELHTNLNYLPTDLIPVLHQIKRVSHVWVSLNHSNARDYYAETGLNFYRTVRNLQTLLDARIPHKIVVGRVASYTDADKQWFQWAKEIFPAATCVVMYRGNWCNNIDAPLVAKIPAGPCARTFELSICTSGTVSYCCMDGLCEYQLGDVNNDNIIDIFNSPKAKAARAMTVRDKEPCKSCTFI